MQAMALPGARLVERWPLVNQVDSQSQSRRRRDWISALNIFGFFLEIIWISSRWPLVNQVDSQSQRSRGKEGKSRILWTLNMDFQSGHI